MDSQCYMESLYQYLNDVHGIHIEKGKDTLEATLSGESIQHFLDIEPQMPVFKRARQTFLPGGEVFEYSICYYLGNRYKKERYEFFDYMMESKESGNLKLILGEAFRQVPFIAPGRVPWFWRSVQPPISLRLSFGTRADWDWMGFRGQST